MDCKGEFQRFTQARFACLTETFLCSVATDEYDYSKAFVVTDQSVDSSSQLEVVYDYSKVYDDNEPASSVVSQEQSSKHPSILENPSMEEGTRASSHQGSGRETPSLLSHTELDSIQGEFRDASSYKSGRGSASRGGQSSMDESYLPSHLGAPRPGSALSNYTGNSGASSSLQGTAILSATGGTSMLSGITGDSGPPSRHARQPSEGGVQQTIMTIVAPSGKLGVIIDTPDEGPPIVHAIKESSVIRDKVQVGDKLVAVDDEDVREMTAIKVSKLISRKGANKERKLTIVRSVRIDEP